MVLFAIVAFISFVSLFKTVTEKDRLGTIINTVCYISSMIGIILSIKFNYE